MKTLGEIAAYIGGRLSGDASAVIKRVVHPALADNEFDLVLVLSPDVIPILDAGKIRNAILSEEMENCPVPNKIVFNRPRLALARVLELFARPVHVAPGIHQSAVVDPSAQIGRQVSIGPFCWIGPGSVVGDYSWLVSHVSVGAGVEIGERTLMHAGVCIGDRCRIGARVIIQSGARIGGDGYAYVTLEPGFFEPPRRATGEVKGFNAHLVRINSIGNVVIEDEVEIGAGTCIDRGTLGETRVGRGSKLDNLVHVGHNVSIGANCLIIAQVGLAGSAKIGDRAVLGGQVGVADHLTIGDDAVVYAQSGITSHVPPHETVAGSPAQLKRDFLAQQMNNKRLPGILRELKELKAQVAALIGKLKGT